MQNQETQKELVLEVLPNEGKIITISTDYELSAPIRCHTLSQEYNLQPGTLLEYQDGKIIAEHDFYDHDYDIAVVLNLRRTTNSDNIYDVYETYGLKHGRWELYRSENSWGNGFYASGRYELMLRDALSYQVSCLKYPPKVSVGDRLLISSRQIIHNITKARSIYELQKDFGQLK